MASIPFFPWKTLLFFLTLLFCSIDTSLAEPLSAPSYSQYCSAIAPEASPTKLLFGASNSFGISNGFFSGGSGLNRLLFPSTRGNTIPGTKSTSSAFYFKPGRVHLTREKGILQLEGTLVLLGAQVPRNRSSQFQKAIFKLSGFWSEAKGKLCMVGTGEIRPSRENQITYIHSAVLKLEYPKASNITTSVIQGTIARMVPDTSQTYFEPISLLAYEQKRYEYTMTERAEASCSLIPEAGGSVAMDGASLCANVESFVRGQLFSSSRLLAFLGSRFILINQLKCSSYGKVHLSMILSNDSLNANDNLSRSANYSIYTLNLQRKLLVAEGIWEQQKSRLCLLACKLIEEKSRGSARSIVGDCDLGLVMWFTETFSLRNRSAVIGQMWNTRDASNNNRNKMVVPLYSTENNLNLVIPGSKYNYTQLETARRHCKIRNLNHQIKGKYPETRLDVLDMSFGLTVHDKNGRYAWGDAHQISIEEIYHGNHRYGGFFQPDNRYTANAHSTNLSSSSSVYQKYTIWNVGYVVSYTFWDENTTESVEISAEGIYNSTSGTLCLVGCRLPKINSARHGSVLQGSELDNENLDCEIFIELQLAPLDANDVKSEGTIFSTRVNSDPLYFHPLNVTFSLIYRHQLIDTYQRIDAEMVMVIFSLTLLCACTYVQLHHTRKNIKTVPMISITMLVLLTIGYIASLILNVEATFALSGEEMVFVQSGRWLDSTDTIVRIITMVALLIQARLLQLAWDSKSKEENTQAAFRDAEKKSLKLCVPLYLAGASIAWFVHSQNHTILEDITRFVGLMVDTFLLPQIIFNIFCQSKENVLSPFFYVGATGVRAVPHIYNTYRSWRYMANINSTDIYANHSGDYYSGLLDIVIPLGGLLFVLIIYLQQKFGGRCFLPL